MKVTQMNSFSKTPSKHKTKIQAAYSPPVPIHAPLAGNIGKFLADFDKDDYILLGLIAVLIFEGCDDYILLAALGYLFIMGLK